MYRVELPTLGFVYGADKEGLPSVSDKVFDVRLKGKLAEVITIVRFVGGLKVSKELLQDTKALAG